MKLTLDKTPQNHRRVGLLGAAAVAIVAGLIGAFSVFPFGKTSYTAILEHTAGLRVGEEVQVAGVGVGEVRKIELDGRRVKVEFVMDREIEAGQDTTAEVKVATLLGTHFLLISPQGGGELPNNTIPLKQTRVPFNLQDVINSTGSLSEKLDVDLITKSLETISSTMSQSSEEFIPALKGISELSAVFARRSEDITTLLKSTSTFTKQLAGSSDDITVLMQQSNILMTEIVQRRQSLHNMLVDLRTIGEEFSSLMRENRDEVGPMLDNINGTIELLRTNHDALGKVADLLGPTARYFANATGSGSWLDQFMPDSTPDNMACSAAGACS